MTTIDALAFTDGSTTSLPPGFSPDQKYGPLLLFDAKSNQWMVGRWFDGWWDDEGAYRINPKAWALLPPAPGQAPHAPDHGSPPRASGDAEVLTLFRQWQRQLVIGNEAGAPDSETERVSELENEIFDTPCGELGDAIKIYLLAQNVLDSAGGRLYSPAEPGVNGYDYEGRLNLSYSGCRALLRNAARRVPELAPLVIEVLIAPSENPD